MSVRRLQKFLCLALAGGSVAISATLARANDTTAAARQASKTKTVQILVAQGNAAMEVKNYASARDTFSDALSLDPSNRDAMVGAALARMELNQMPQAMEMIDKAAANGVPAPNVAINAAVIHIRGKDPTRAARILKTYLAAVSTAHDEKAYDLFITALSQFSSQAKQNDFYRSCQTFAALYAEKLSTDHPGEKLWGVQWLASDQADQKAADSKAQQTAIDTAEAKVASLDRQVASAQGRYDTVKSAYDHRLATRYALHDAENRLNDLQSRDKDAQDAADDAMAKVEQPPLLTSIDPLLPGDTDQVASETPSSTDSNNPVLPPTELPKPSAPPQAMPNPPTPAPAEPPKKVAVTNYAVAFAVAPTLAITDASAVKDSSDFNLQCPDGTVVQATLLRTDATGKLALLQLQKKVAYLDIAPAFTGGSVICTGFPEVNIFNPTAAAISGNAPAPADEWQIKLSRHPRLGGAPLTTSAGKLVGVELADRDSDPAKIPAASLEAIRTFVGGDLPAPGHGTASPSGAIFQLVSTTEP